MTETLEEKDWHILSIRCCIVDQRPDHICVSKDFKEKLQKELGMGEKYIGLPHRAKKQFLNEWITIDGVRLFVDKNLKKGFRAIYESQEYP